MKSTHKVVLTAEIKVFPGFEQEILAAAEKNWIATRQEQGCESFMLHTGRESKASILVFEIFSSEEAFEFHKHAPHTRAFMASLKGKVEGDAPVLTFYTQYED